MTGTHTFPVVTFVTYEHPIGYLAVVNQPRGPVGTYLAVAVWSSQPSVTR